MVLYFITWFGITAISFQIRSSNGNSADFAIGADVSWVTEMESSGHHFKGDDGKEQDLFAILSSKHINAIRLRLFVNPKDGWCNTEDTVAKALRAKAAGMRLMLDFHYSDTWADPPHQYMPAAWQDLDFNNLMPKVYSYTEETLKAFKDKGLEPEWVQVGNEVTDGMLWPYADKITSYRWMFDGLKKNGAEWDVIGMSLYPSLIGGEKSWSDWDKDCLANMKDMVSRYGKEVILSEVGMPADDPDTSKKFLTDITAKAKSVPKALGVFYWEPECYNNWKDYKLGAFDTSGKPTDALNAF